MKTRIIAVLICLTVCFSANAGGVGKHTREKKWLLSVEGGYSKTKKTW